VPVQKQQDETIEESAEPPQPEKTQSPVLRGSHTGKINKMY
jgi:hypothetical protein